LARVNFTSSDTSAGMFLRGKGAADERLSNSPLASWFSCPRTTVALGRFVVQEHKKDHLRIAMGEPWQFIDRPAAM